MIQFPKADLHGVLRQRVNNYFSRLGISKYGGKKIVIKSVVLLALLFIPYGILLTYNLNSISMLLLAATMGVAIAGLGMGVMHDCIHGSFSSSSKINKWWGTLIYVLIIGGNPIWWRLQHNVLHHRFTNIHDVDEDLNPYGFMRFCPHDKQKSIFRFQHLYAIFLYALTTLIWVLHKEFAQLKRYFSMGLIKSKAQYTKELRFLIISKAIYYSYMLVIPMMILNINIFQWIIGFIVMHAVTGIILAVVFQLAHVIENTDYPLPDNSGNIAHDWASHQVKTTSDFSPNNRLLTWFIGGLNYQIEHHFFPTICHVHYPKIARIVQKTVKEYGLEYYCYPTLRIALKAHFNHLYTLGQTDMSLVNKVESN
ncbi:Stearoyl-CoA 9-desaturase [Legionella massiliensis]|uniref:Stearoyl-CoA 9-desaturase n=1 Tax=Legionella massiliensis TaxID=1034943 RepID=A0A078KUC7_9GAMM|nr:acyl-CoA desaturase [Legionella massiliensis]CDZ76641.1 Stearoyl-CoA 9-desaturase [Legionella massiliensis]CEE12379.1 Stearoyl-CoA 9-desaturase [Legionella massiliensis]